MRTGIMILWIIVFIPSVFLGIIFAKSFWKKKRILAVMVIIFFMLPILGIPAISDVKYVEKEFVVDRPYADDMYIKTTHGNDFVIFNYLGKNGEERMIKVSDKCKIRYKDGKQNRIKYSKTIEKNPFGKIIYKDVSEVEIETRK